jgi:crotonobetainyl-CoA:carnitine CoA-transferase CaiB-like acyl-CoA transferase
MQSTTISKVKANGTRSKEKGAPDAISRFRRLLLKMGIAAPDAKIVLILLPSLVLCSKRVAFYKDRVDMAEITWKDYKERKRTKPAPLKGIKVLEVCTMLLGPMGPALLAQLGAEVIRCEIPPLGDSTRSLNPFGWFLRDQSPLLLHINQNKYWLGIDLHKPEAQKLLCELAATCDIVENNFRPGVMEEWNIGYRQIREINPGIIFLSKSGYGQWGQYAKENRPSNDGASQALTGYSWMSRFPGQTPLKLRAYIGDNYGAMAAEIAVLAALHYRDRTGKGQFIEFSQTENIMRRMSWIWPYLQLTGKLPQPAGNRDVSICPADTFRCCDDTFVALAAPAPEEFAGLCRRWPAGISGRRAVQGSSHPA